jgi:small-conductance mechanosensitive channel/CRP-like cAMP-binding protein
MTVYSIIIGVAAFALLGGARAASSNRLIRRKLTLSLVLLAGFVMLSLAQVVFIDPTQKAQAEIAARLESIAYLLLALGSISALVSLILNPFRADRVPDFFPTIVQDAIIIGGFLLVGIFLLGEKWLTLSAVGGFVIGFALQDTLGNMFAGLAIQVEKPFRVGQWISVASYEGLVTEITWRATRLRTKTGNSIVVPNNILSREAITNFSEPTSPTRLFVDVGVTYDAPPNEVKRVLLQALSVLDLLLKTPPPEVVVADFAASAITYRVKFWVADFAADDQARDQVRTAVYYALKRHGIEIPYPQQVQYAREETPARSDARGADLDRLVASVDVFAPLAEADRATLVAASAERLYGAGEAIVRQGEPGESMFVVCSGEVRVTLEPSGQEVARIPAGRYFGEMSLLTGEPRTATVSAINDAVVLEITAASFRRLASVHPAVVEQISLEVAARREGLERSREVAAVAAAAVPEARRTFLARVQKFLGFVS